MIVQLTMRTPRLRRAVMGPEKVAPSIFSGVVTRAMGSRPRDASPVVVTLASEQAEQEAHGRPRIS